MEVIENAKPQKKHFRQRAHSNPLADHSFIYPVAPNVMNWQPFYPHYFTADGSHSTAADPRKVEILDIGCGYGGMCIALAPLFPELLILGMEIRVKVSAFVNQRILALREQNKNSSKNQEKAVQENDHSKQNIDSQNTPLDHNFQNVSVIRTNAMKYMTNFFHKGQLKKMFFLFPDPHFKQKKHKWRIISETLLAEYAYVMAVGGIVYTMTDVADLHEWMTSHFTAHPLFERVTAEEYANDPVVEKLYDSTEEGQKVTRNKGDKFLAIFRRIEDPFVVTLAEY